MKISLNWLQDFVSFETDDLNLIQEKITNCSAEIEEIIEEGKSFENVVIGQILEIKKHPDADKLSITQTEIGAETLQIVCGAKNIREGQKVPVALAGACLPNGLNIQKTKIRGRESNGMICSEVELGVAEESAGIWELPDNVQVGMQLAEYLGMNDTVLDIDNTAITNRPDLFSHIGFANEFVANGLAKNKKKIVTEISKSKKSFPIQIEITSDDLCSRYTAIVLDNIEIKPSSEWMQRRLRAVGIRPINNIVDITNYVMMELGMPMHAFDLSKISGKKMVMRKSKAQEKVITLDEIERKLPEDVIVLEDQKKIFDLCGIMGGKNSEISEKTKTILLHAPVYNSTLIRKGMIALAHRTEAATMYEKGVPNVRSLQGLQRAVELILELIPQAKVESEVFEYGYSSGDDRVIDLPKSEVKRVLNTEIEDKVIVKILTDLKFQVTTTPQEFQITVPEHRYGDITGQHDLIEEIVRIYDVNRIQEVLPVASLKPTAINKNRVLERKIKNTLAALGFNEVLTHTFIGPKLLQKSKMKRDSRTIEITNPISQDISLMQTSLLPSLFEIIEKNTRFQETINLFEFGRVYFRANDTKIDEEKHFAGVCLGVDFFEVKGKIDYLLHLLGFTPRYAAPQNTEDFMHPVRTADILIGNELVGYITEIHVLASQNFDLKSICIAFEINFSRLLDLKQKKIVYKPVPKFPSINLDVSVLINQNTTVEKLIKAINKTDKLINVVEMIDLYEGKQISKGKKSVTFSIVYQAEDRTLTDAEVNIVHQNVIINLEKTGAEIRI